MAAPFSGIRMLDLSRLLPGAYCSLLFADLGAEVIKVEEPGRGDYARSTTPYWGDSGVGTYFLLLNRNKKSVTLNLKSEGGRAAFRRLVETADVLLESFRPGSWTAWGSDSTALRALNPRLVYCAISGYGQDGPYRDLVGHDINYMGYAGALSVTGPREGAPLPSGVQVADLGGGSLTAAFGIATALLHRRQSGEGQLIDASMTDGVVSWMAPYLGPYFATGAVPGRGEERLNGGWACYQVFETADGRYLTLGALEPRFWQNLCRLIGREDLVPHQHAQGAERDRLESELRAIFRSRPRDEWVLLLHTEDVCAGPVSTLDEVVRDPQFRARGLFQEVDTPGPGTDAPGRLPGQAVRRPGADGGGPSRARAAHRRSPAGAGVRRGSHRGPAPRRRSDPRPPASRADGRARPRAGGPHARGRPAGAGAAHHAGREPLPAGARDHAAHPPPGRPRAYRRGHRPAGRRQEHAGRCPDREAAQDGSVGRHRRRRPHQPVLGRRRAGRPDPDAEPHPGHGGVHPEHGDPRQPGRAGPRHRGGGASSSTPSAWPGCWSRPSAWGRASSTS